jgi:hypothetical protein
VHLVKIKLQKSAEFQFLRKFFVFGKLKHFQGLHLRFPSVVLGTALKSQRRDERDGKRRRKALSVFKRN